MALAAAACGGKDASEKAPYKVGLVVPSSGPDSASGAAARQGAELAVEEVNADTANLFHLALTVVHAPADAQAAAAVCQRLATQDGVEAIIGYDTGAARAACSRAAEQAGIPYLAAARSPDDNCSANFFQIAPIPNQESEAALGYLGEQKARRLFVIGSHADSMRVVATTRGIEALRMTVAGTRTEPAGAPRPADALAAISAARPDAVVEALTGGEQAAFYRQAGSSGLRFASLELGDSAARAVGPNADVVSLADYFPEVQMPATQKFVSALRTRHGEGARPTAGAALAYDAVRVLATAATAATSTAGASVIGAIPAVKLDGPRGSFFFPAHSHYATVNMFVARVHPDGTLEMLTYRPGVEAKSNCG
jgi:branched-chain amino acid transport system substrate-binding protein